LASLSQLLLYRSISQEAPLHRDDDEDPDGLNIRILVEDYLPFEANTVSIEENAKVSLLVETLTRIFVLAQGSTYSFETHIPSLKNAIEKGIAAREAKITSDRRRRATRTKEEDVDGKMWLNSSGKRLRALATML
jgi:hypothetical protein